MIKPIETIYSGYRFRSRLEARWAVFFETIGVKWEYEKEGFDIDGEYYLPDFYLPEKNMWVEIKPLANGIFSDYPPSKIYLAGKIAHNNWRNHLVNFSNKKVLDHFNYVGPYYVNLDKDYSTAFIHSKEGDHGEPDHYLMPDHGGYCNHDGYCFQDIDEAKGFIADNCLNQIKEADFVFAWIDSFDCYGTLFELGYAHANNKIIKAGFCNKLKPENYKSSHHDDEVQRSDFWFIQNYCQSFDYYPSALKAFKSQTSWLKNIPKKYENFAKHKPLLYLCGDFHNGYNIMPYILEPCEYTDEEPNQKYESLDNIFGALNVDKGLARAKKARFEHGECG